MHLARVRYHIEIEAQIILSCGHVVTNDFDGYEKESTCSKRKHNGKLLRTECRLILGDMRVGPNGFILSIH